MKVGWQVIPLGSVATFVMGQAPPGATCNMDGVGTPFVKAGEFGKERPIIREWTTDPKKFAEQSDVLICVVGATCGKINLGAECAIGRSVAAIRPQTRLLDQFYLHYFLSGQVTKLRGGSLGAAQTVISRDMLAVLPIPLPPLDDQKRIVAVLDEAFEGVSRARANAEANIVDAAEAKNRMEDSYLTSAAGTWETGTLEKVGGKVFTGPFGSLLHKSDYVKDGVPLINPAHIVGTEICPEAGKTVSLETAKRLANYRLKIGDIVFGRRGEMGRCAVIRHEHVGWLCGTGSFIIRPFEKVVPDFLAHLLRSRCYRPKIEALAAGATMPNLSNTALGNLIVAIPSEKEQRDLLDRFDNLDSSFSELNSQHCQKQVSIDALRQSLLQKAFSGELT